MARGKAELEYGAAAIAIATAADQSAPTAIQLLAIGKSPSRNGKPPYVVVDDRAHAERIAAATAAHHRSNDIVVDYDHQSMFGARAGVGGTARAAGWMKRVYASDQGVFADVEWTDAAASALGAREYRYISPVFQHDAQGRVVRIINAALTNTPSLDLAAVASAFSTADEGKSMNFANIAKALGLGDDATEEEILRAIANHSNAATMTAIATALGVAEDADLVAAATALKAGADKPDPTKFVPIAAVTELQTSVQSLTAALGELQGDKLKAKIEQAQTDGRLPPALVAHATSITDGAQLDAFLAALPVGGLGSTAIEGDAAKGAKGKLTADEIAVCSAMGLTEEEYTAARTAEQEGKN